MASYSPTSVPELAELLQRAAAAGQKLEIRGGASKVAIGAPRESVDVLDMRGFSQVIDYDPTELVVTVGAGVRLTEVEALLAERHQCLGFAPFDHSPIFGLPAGTASIGGVIAAGVAGSAGLSMGTARNHVLGMAGVTGRGQTFRAGAKVVKNVTGYDLPKLLTGSWGRLAAMTELTLKVCPRPEVVATRVIRGLDPRSAASAMARAAGSQAHIAAAAHVPAQLGAGTAVTAFRLDGVGPSVSARCTLLAALLQEHGPLEMQSPREDQEFWQDLRTLRPLADGRPLWRLSIPSRALAEVAAALQPMHASWLADWAGALLWVCVDGDGGELRGIAQRAGGHAMLVRAGAALRSARATFHPRPAAVAAVEQRVIQAFDPAGVFATTRFRDDVHAD